MEFGKTQNLIEGRVKLALAVLISLYFASHNMNPREKKDISNELALSLCVNAGLTFDNNTKTLLEGKKEVFVVSLEGFEKTYNVDDFSSDDLAKYLIKFSKQLKDPKYHLGGWIDNGKVYLDISIELPDEASARVAAIQNNQKAYYNFATGKEVFVGQN